MTLVETSEVPLAKVTTGTGDDGYTGLLGDERPAKYHPRIQALGDVDEATSLLGVARSLVGSESIANPIRDLQSGLYLLMADIAVAPGAADRFEPRVTEELVRRVEESIEQMKLQVDIGNRFVVPGDSTAGAAVDLARAVIRRAERSVVRLAHGGELHNPHVTTYLNRASDLAFVLARYVDESSEQE